MKIWLQQQTAAVLTALAHARELYGASTPAQAPGPFTPPADLEARLGAGLL